MRTPWCTSYFSLMPRRIEMVSSTDGSLTKTGWKRRASAASFSICLRYSSSVVAPTQCSSPRASAGFNILEASIAPSALPAPIRVCNSSMKTMMSPSAAEISDRTALRRSSNSPRYLAPATMAPRSSAISFLPFSDSGTSSLTMRSARPSAMAVLPTPGSPIRTGLFLVRRLSTWMTRRISSSRPITGSSLPSAASLVRSPPYFSRGWDLDSGFWSVTPWLPRIWRGAEVGLPCAADLGKSLDDGDERRLEGLDGDAGAFEQGPADAVLLPDERQDQVLGLDGLLAEGAREVSSFLERLLGLFCEFFQTHVLEFPPNPRS